MRRLDNRIIAGVCAGIAAEMEVSPWVIRAIFVLMFLPGIPFYLYMWLSRPPIPTES